MRIVDVATTVVGAPWRELTFVELVADDGGRGLAEVRMVNKTDTLVACIAELADRYVVGADPFDRETLAFNIQRAEYSRPGEITQSALTAFDVACWDLVGQALNVPVWKLLGGKYRERVRAYANGWYQTDRDPAALAEKALDAVARGYTALKLDPFGSAWMTLPPAERRRSIELVAAVREAVGPDVEIMIEMHGRFSRRPQPGSQPSSNRSPRRGWRNRFRSTIRAGSPAFAARRADRSRRVSACIFSRTSARSSSRDSWTSCKRTSRTSAASRACVAWQGGPRRTSSRLRHTTSAARWERWRTSISRSPPRTI